MSNLIENDNSPQTGFFTAKYGIKPKKQFNVWRGNTIYGVKLPIGFENESEARELEQQVRMLYDDVEISTDKIKVTAMRNKGLVLCHVLPARIQFEGYVEIVAKPSISISYTIDPGCRECSDWSSKKLDWSSFEKECKTAMDTILRNTIIGRKLKEYWIREDKISDVDAKKRLEEITPYAMTQVLCV